jgi:hypothetical protein
MMHDKERKRKAKKSQEKTTEVNQITARKPKGNKREKETEKRKKKNQTSFHFTCWESNLPALSPI